MVITKRDGSREQFSLPKLRSCLMRVLRAGNGQVHLADPLARAIAAHVSASCGQKPPTSRYIYRCAYTALMQTGLADASVELVVQRRARVALCRRLRVCDDRNADRPAEHWRRSEIVATLQSRYQLGRGVARFLSGRVEQQIIASGCQLVSKANITKLVEREVAAWGLLDEPATEPRDVPTDGGATAVGGWLDKET